MTVAGNNPALFVADTSAIWTGSDGGDAAIAPGASVAITVLFRPEDVGAFDAELIIETSLGAVTFDLTGDGTAETCVPQVARCAIGDGPAESDVVRVSAGDPVICAVYEQRRNGDRLVDVQMDVVQRPVRSGAGAEKTSFGRTTFVADLPTTSGPYILQAAPPIDDSGLRCPPATAEVWVDKPGELYAVLTWETPADSDPNDTGTGRGSDVDLHMRHEAGCWRSYWDCYFGNADPTWPESDGPGYQRVSLLRDDTDGYGPEVMRLAAGDAGIRYTFGVEYTKDWGLGESTAELRFYAEGRELDRIAFGLDQTGDFVEVGYVDWPSLAVVPTLERHPENRRRRV